MAKSEPLVTFTKAELKKKTRSEQRRLIDLGLVQGEPAPKVEAKTEPKAK